MKQSLVETTPLLGEVRPVTVEDHNDLASRVHGMDDGLATEHGLRDIVALPGEKLSSLTLLQHYGVKGYNQVVAKSASRTILAIGGGDPLLVRGHGWDGTHGELYGVHANAG